MGLSLFRRNLKSGIRDPNVFECPMISDHIFNLVCICCRLQNSQDKRFNATIRKHEEEKASLKNHHSSMLKVSRRLVNIEIFRALHQNRRAAGSIPAKGYIVAFFTTAPG